MPQSHVVSPHILIDRICLSLFLDSNLTQAPTLLLSGHFWNSAPGNPRTVHGNDRKQNIWLPWHNQYGDLKLYAVAYPIVKPFLQQRWWWRSSPLFQKSSSAAQIRLLHFGKSLTILAVSCSDCFSTVSLTLDPLAAILFLWPAHLLLSQWGMTRMNTSASFVAFATPILMFLLGSGHQERGFEITQ